MVQEPLIHLIVEEGPDQGREIPVQPSGIRVGRSSNNDVALRDPVMSRYHCRFFFKPNEGMWIEDLGSSNNTLLNSAQVKLSRIHVGDRITLGDTILKVINDEYPSPAAGRLFGAPEKEIDAAAEASSKKSSLEPLRRNILTGLLVICSCAAAAGFIVHWQKNQPAAATPNRSSANETPDMEIAYEKVEAGPKNIFRYELELKNNELSVQIDDLENKRHVPKNQSKKIDAEVVRSLIRSLDSPELEELKENYKGNINDVYDLMDLTITIGKNTRHVRVLNTIEPEQFKKAREIIEEFARNEIGLSALALTREKLLELAKSSYLSGRSLYDQREVRRDNLAMAIRALKETEWYLETIDPKPDYYADSIALLRECERDLQETYQGNLFLAERAIKLKDWTEAAAQLRIILEKIPERSDERYQNAQKKLLDVERHLKKK